MQYLDCLSTALATSSCWGSVGGESNWDAFERSWFQTACPTPPSSVMTQLPQPSTVQLELSPVSTIIPPGPITAPPPPVAPTNSWSEGAPLLEGDCTATSFSLIQGDNMVVYVPFVGCDNARPECCPFNVRTAAADGSKQEGNRIAAVPGQFPQPQSGDMATLARCPMDYYSVPGGLCCPKYVDPFLFLPFLPEILAGPNSEGISGYFKFTSTIASATPCFSSLAVKASPPVITAGDPQNPANSNLPTSAILNVVWAMGYNVGASQAGSSSRLSTGAIIGIAVGVGLLVVLVGVLAAFAVLKRKKKKKSESQSFVGPIMAQTPGAGGMAYKPGYHAPPGSPPPVSTASPAGSPGPKYAGTVSSQYAPSAVTSAGGGGYSDHGRAGSGGGGGWQEQHGLYPSGAAYGGGWQQQPVHEGHAQQGYGYSSDQGPWPQQQQQQQSQGYEPYRRHQLE
ncbi:hypothetical protein B0T21DRAFT_926 [Apiosordaria backusii]|uniref:Uncharacterized protein n=1 Tax=Apiosordaria backusii TaxID=314023 RepID=A0AA40EXL5_9PEZI|nr:hypothetical protein B0T21DRAFT_926 [Apiosordaria backusii]